MEIERAYDTDPVKETKGVPVDIAGSEWILARVNNPQWRKLAYQRAQDRRAGRRSSEESQRMTVDLLTDSIVRGWCDTPRNENESEEDYKRRCPKVVCSRRHALTGMPEGELHAIPFSKDAVRTVLDRWPDLVDDVFTRANEIERYQEASDEETVGNS